MYGENTSTYNGSKNIYIVHWLSKSNQKTVTVWLQKAVRPQWHNYVQTTYASSQPTKSFISKTFPARSIFKEVQHNITPVYAVLLYEAGKGMNK